MSKKGTPKSRAAIEANIEKLRVETRNARLAMALVIVGMLAFMLIVQLTPLMSLLPFDGVGAAAFSVIALLAIMLVASFFGERAKTKAQLLRDQEALLERAKAR